MPLPRTILIDTVIFDEHAYNFASPTMLAFLQIAQNKYLTLVLPDPIEREVKRHIKRNSYAALRALEDARRKAPFVTKWKDWPKTKINDATKAEIEALADAEWEEFLKTFNVKKLGYGE